MRTLGIGGRIASLNDITVDGLGRMTAVWDQTDGLAGSCGESYGCWRSGSIVGP